MPTDINAPPAVVSAPVDTTTPAPAPDVAAFHQSLQPTAAPSQLPAQAQEAAAAQPQPVTLSPEYLAQSTVAPPPTAAPVTLSPDYLAKSTVTPETPKVVNPLTDWSTADLVKAARANPKDFDPVSMFESLPFYDKTPETTAKMADVFHDLQAGGNLLPSAGTIAKNAVKVPWEFAKRLFYQGGSLPGDVAALAGASDQSTTAGALAQEARQTAAETVAGTKSSLFGLAKMGDTIAKRLMGKPLADFTPADKMAAFQFELAARQKISDLAGGGEKAQELAAAGTPMRPERVSTFAQTDPFSWELMGKAFSGATQVAKLGGAAVLGTTPAEISAALSGPASALATGTAKVVGGAINQTAGAIKPVVELAGKAAPWTGKIVGGASGVTAGHALAGPLGALGGIMEGAKVGTETGERFAAGAEKIAGILDRIQDVGKQIAGSEPLVSPTAVAGRNLSLALPGAATSVASGVGFDMGLQAATANTPADREGFTPFGTVFGFAHAAGLTGSRLLSGQILAPRENGSAVKIPNTGYFPALNALHDTAYASETPGVQQRINALRALAKGGAPNTDVFFAPHPEEGQADQLPAALQASGIDPANAQNFAAQRGAFIQLKDVNGRNIVVFRDIDSAPHEVKHALDDALGSQAVEALNQDTKKQYTPQEWNAFTQHYGDLLTTTGEPAENPGAMILDKSNWGDAAAREKIIRQVHDALAAEGQDLTGPALKEAAGNAILKAQGDAQAAGTSLWEHQLTPEEQQRVLDNYIGGELRAENFQAWSNGMGASRAIPDRMATAVANLVHMLGGNPLAGATTDIGAPLNWATMRQGAEGVQALHPTIPPAKLPQVKAPVGSAKGIAQQGARDEAIVQNAPDVKLPGMAKSQREMAGALNEAKLSNSPVDIQYGHAGETAPAGGAGDLPAPILGAVKRSQRRDVIEAWRSLPVETRSFMSTLFSPEQFHMTQDGKVQVYGVSHAVVAANLQKLAAMKLAHPELPLPTGVDVDPNTKSFTPESWKYLLENLSKYSANQTTGRTGSGAELVVPKMKGYNAPPVTGSAEPIPQDLADMFNAAYGQHTPTTARITKKDIVPLNIAGQRVSEATMPGRVEHPSPESPVFGEGTKEANDRAKALGISGEHVLEPNPFIQKLNAYPDAPSFIEARQRLNVEHMADVNEAPSGAPSLKGNTLTLAAGFKPQVREFLDTLQKTNPEEWRAVVDPFRGRYGGGQTGLSAEVGSQVTSPEEVKQLRSAQAHYEGLAKAAFSANDIDAASIYINKAQAAREASEMAEGGGTAEFVKKYYDPNYKAPLSPGGTTSTPAQLLPPPLEQFKDDPRQSVDPERADDRTAERFFHGALDSSDETGYDSRVISAQLKPTKKDDRLELTHYSGTPGLSKLDPSFSGTGLPGAESKRARDYPELFVPRTYFGTPDYKKEPGLGNLAYKAEVRSGKIYDFQADPKELYPTSEELESNGYAPFDQRAAVSLYEKRIHEAGYEGYINKDANAVAKFTATAVKKATPAQFSPAKPFYSQLEKTVEDKMPESASGESLAAMLRNPQNGVKADELKWSGLRKTAMEQGFAQFRPNAPKPEEFKSADTLPAASRAPNWAILTGTQEALGPATAPANVQNNEVLQNELKAAGFAPQTVSGSYEGVDQGKSFLVTGMTPEQALEWGKRFKQDSVLTQAGYLYHDNTVAPADHTKNSYGAEAKQQPGWSQVEGGPAFSMGIEFGKREPVKQAQMELGGGAPENRPLSSQELGDMSDTELRAHYPEALVPNRVRNASGKLVEPQIPSEIADSPLAKEEGAAGFAKKLVSMANDWKDHPAFKSGLRWYSEFTPMLKKAFGKTAGIMAEFLAATSPQTAPDQNFAYALDAHQGLASGRFDKIISKYKEGLDKLEDGTWKTWFAKEVAAGRASEPKSGPTEAAFLGQWVEKHDLLPRQSNGQKYGQNSRAVLNVLARTWLDQNTGPKTLNFVKNLLGEGHGATIDVWADRTMRRLGYEGKQDRWRILPQNKTGVSDKDFAFAQDAFKQAAKQLGVKPDALQGALWFAEKQLWADRGWGRLDFGDFREEIKKMPMLLKGIEQRLAATAARQSAPKAVQPDLLVSPRNLRK